VKLTKTLDLLARPTGF